MRNSEQKDTRYLQNQMKITKELQDKKTEAKYQFKYPNYKWCLQ